MVINYYGKQFFKIQVGDTVLAINPPGADSKIKAPRFGADVAFSTLPLPDYNGVEQLAYGDREPFTIIGPGEYEVKGALIRGIGTTTTIEGEPYINTAYSIVFDNIHVLFLGSIGKGAFTTEHRHRLPSSPDILFVPVGSTISFDEAYKLATELEANVVIPMEYDDKSLKKFLEEAGSEKVTPIEKLTIRKKELDEKKGEIVVLTQPK